VTKHPEASARRILRPLRRGALAAGAFIAFAAVVSGQAWVPPAGVGSVNFLSQYTDHTGHLLADGSKLGGYDSVSSAGYLEVDYAFTNRLSISAGLAYVGAKYLGPEPSYGGELDDCHCWNSDWQDAGLTVRYNLFNGSFALTPSIAYGAPTANYPYYGEATIGRRLDELRLAVDAGMRLDTISPKLSLSGRYSFAFVEKAAHIGTNRSDLLMSIGYQFTSRLSASTDFYLQRTHGGLKSTEFVTDEQWAQYDRLIKDDSFHIGATLAYSFERWDLYASYIQFVDGTDTHVGHAISVGISWPFEF
jgi:hypothetical protein